jgi:hypothetical protein
LMNRSSIKNNSRKRWVSYDLKSEGWEANLTLCEELIELKLCNRLRNIDNI